VLEVARRAGASRPAVWRWQRRYGEQGVDGLLRDKTRKPGKAPLSAKAVAKVLELTCSEPPGEVTHWTGQNVKILRRTASAPAIFKKLAQTPESSE
jgi:transposase